MKMNYRRNHTNERKKRLLLGAFVALIFLFALARFFEPVSGFFTTLASPLWGAGQYAQNQAGALLAATRITPDITEENKRLKHDLAVLKGESALFDILEAENKILKEKLGIPQERLIEGDGAGIAPAARAVAAILSRPPKTPYDVLIVGVGREAGVAAGDTVFASEHIILGEVVSVGSHTAKVSLFSSPGVTTEALLLRGESSLAVEATGVGGGAFEFLVPRDAEIANGDVLTRPRNDIQALAVVEEVLSDQNSPFKAVYARLPINMQEVRWVEIATGR